MQGSLLGLNWGRTSHLVDEEIDLGDDSCVSADQAGGDRTEKGCNSPQSTKRGLGETE